MKIDVKSNLFKRLIIIGVIVIVIASIGLSVLCAFDWSYCQHTLEEVAGTDATCMKMGKKVAYKCTKCGKLYAYGYANGESGVKELYEIDAQQTADYAGHKLGELYGDIKSTSETYDVSSLEDFSVWSHCSEEGCGIAYEVDTSLFVPFAPADNLSIAKHVVEGDYTDATTFAIPAGIAANTCYTITTADSGKMNRATYQIPFTANTDRFVVLFFHNDGNADVNVRYGTEFYTERCGVDVTVPAHGYATGMFSINISGSNSNSYHELYIKSNVVDSFNLTISGYYYHDAKLQRVTVDSYPQIEYAIGETFNPDGLKVAATYADGVSIVVPSTDYTLSLANGKSIDEPLTEDDKAVYITYGKKQSKIDIVVKRFEQNVTLNGAKFADGESEKVLDRSSLLPTDIVADNGKAIAYFLDQYNTKYELGTAKVPAYDVVLTPIYVGYTFSSNYALGMTATASSTYHGGKLTALTDGKNSVNSADDDRWSSKSNTEASPSDADKEWVCVDLGESKTIMQVVLYPRVWGSYFPEAYEVLISEDGENWTSVVNVEKDELALTNSTLGRMHFITESSARYIKVIAHKMTDDHGGSANYVFQLSEIEVYGLVSEN